MYTILKHLVKKKPKRKSLHNICTQPRLRRHPCLCPDSHGQTRVLQVWAEAIPVTPECPWGLASLCRLLQRGAWSGNEEGQRKEEEGGRKEWERDGARLTDVWSSAWREQAGIPKQPPTPQLAQSSQACQGRRGAEFTLCLSSVSAPEQEMKPVF